MQQMGSGDKLLIEYAEVQGPNPSNNLFFNYIFPL